MSNRWLVDSMRLSFVAPHVHVKPKNELLISASFWSVDPAKNLVSFLLLVLFASTALYHLHLYLWGPQST